MDEILAKLDELKAGQERLAERLDRVEVGQVGVLDRLDRLESKVDRLESKVDRLDQGQQRLEAHVGVLTRRVDEHYVDVLRAVSESNETVLGALGPIADALSIRKAS